MKRSSPLVRLTLALMALAAVALLATPSAAATRRALVVGINAYASADSGPDGRWRDLRGAVNDARAMRELLITRWGFAPEDVLLLLDDQATRAAILGGISDHLMANASEGDVALFYYAGHGSQVANPASLEVDALDETLVPADSNRGARDIRDKELRRLFNDGLDRGARVVAIVDSCSSGSILRSFDEVRFLPPARVGAPELPPLFADERGAPADRGALILSAAATGRPARETRDAQGRARGAFSHALLRALREAAPSESAEQVFLRARAAVLADGRGQVPVLQATGERRRQPLLGAGSTAVALPRFAVLRVDTSGAEPEVEIDAGLASGVHPGTVLTTTQPGTTVRLRVVAAQGAGTSRAVFEDGDVSDLEPGALLRIASWAPPAGVGLRISLGSEIPETLRASVQEHATRRGDALELVEADRAHYALQPVDGSGPEPRFAWVRRGSDATGTASGLPERSDDFSADEAVGLTGSLDILLRIRSWLTLEGPPSGDDFPYHLALRRHGSDRRVIGGVVQGGEGFVLHIERDSGSQGPVQSRHVYVFAIDAHGEQVLIFPDLTSGNAENLLPPAGLGSYVPESIQITSIEVSPPFGSETLVMLTTERALSDPRLLEGEGVRTKRTMGNLENILSSVGRGMDAPPTSTRWSVERISLRSRAPE